MVPRGGGRARTEIEVLAQTRIGVSLEARAGPGLPPARSCFPGLTQAATPGPRPGRVSADCPQPAAHRPTWSRRGLRASEVRAVKYCSSSESESS